METAIVEISELFHRRFLMRRFMPKDVSLQSETNAVEFIDLSPACRYIRMKPVSEHSIEIMLCRLHSHSIAMEIAHTREANNPDYFPNDYILISTFSIFKEYGTTDKYLIALLVLEGQPELRHLELDDIADFVESEFKSFESISNPPA
jgi:hypothetical protein